MTCLFCYHCRLKLDLPTGGKMVFGQCERCRASGMIIYG